MRLSVKGLAMTASLVWGLAVLISGLLHLASPTYASMFLQVVSSLYPGFHGGTGIVDVIVGTLYAMLDGGVCGLVFASIYNFFAAKF